MAVTVQRGLEKKLRETVILLISSPKPVERLAAALHEAAA